MPTLTIPGPFPVNLPVANTSDLPSVNPYTGAELLEIEQGGANFQGNLNSIANYNFNYINGTFSTILVASGNANTDTANLIAAINRAASSARLVTGYSDPIGTAVIYFGPGTFFINQVNAMMSALTLASKLRGMMFIGCGGVGQTAIVFTPPAAGPFMTNQRWQALVFVDIAFSSTVAGCDFMQSQEQGGVTNIQYNSYIRCSFNGFQNTFMLTGGNNNSEWLCDTCTFGLTQNNVLYVPAGATATITSGSSTIAIVNSPEAFPLGATMTFTSALGNLAANTTYFIINATTTSIQIAATANGAAIVPTLSGSLTASAASDQFLNFSFRDCKYNPGNSSAPWVNMAKGGHIVFSGYADCSGWAPTVDTYLINTLGVAHARGVQNLLVNKLRVECLSAHALLWHNQWAGGNCTWQNVDQSSTLQAATINHVLVELANNIGPEIVWDNCSFQGTHTYSFGSNNYLLQTSIQYRSCAALQYSNAKSFCLFSGAVNLGGTPTIAFDINCRGSGLGTEIFPCNLGWNLSTTGIATPWSCNFTGPNSSLPFSGGNVQRTLPLNSVITSVYLSKAADAQAGAFNFTLQTTDPTPVVVANFSGANAGLAMNFISTQAFYLGSDTSRTLTLVDTQNRGPVNNAVFVVEYSG